MPIYKEGSHPLSVARMRAKLTQPELAAAARAAATRSGFRSGIDKNRIWKWESGHCTPSEESQSLLCAALGLPDGQHLTAPWPEWLEPLTPIFDMREGGAVSALDNALGDHMDRRTTFKGMGAAVVALATGWASADPARAQHAIRTNAVDDTLVAWLGQTAAVLAAIPTEQRQYMEGALRGHLTTVTGFIKGGQYTESTGRKLYQTAAHLTHTLGWYTFDHGKHAQAAAYWNATVHASRQSGDTSLGAFALSDLAYQQLWLGEPNQSAKISELIDTTKVESRVAAVTYLRHAQALARTGERGPSLRKIDQAEHRIGTAQEERSWAQWVGEGDVSVDRGRCLMYLGNPREAMRHMQSGVRYLNTERDKTRAVIQVYEAEILSHLGDDDHASSLLADSINIASRIGAPRCIQMARRVGSDKV